MNKNTATEIVWILALGVLTLGIFYALGISAAFNKFVTGFGDQDLYKAMPYSTEKLAIIFFVPIAFIAYLVRIIVQKAKNNQTLVTGSIILLVGVIAFSDLKSYINIVGVDFRHFKLSLLGTGGNLFPEAARIMTLLKSAMIISGVMIVVYICFLIRNHSNTQKEKAKPVEEDTDANTPLDQVNI